MGDRLVQTFKVVWLLLQVQMAGNCKLATLLQRRKLCTKHREYNRLSLLLLYRQIKLQSLVKHVGSLVGIKTGSKNRSYLPQSENSSVPHPLCKKSMKMFYLKSSEEYGGINNRKHRRECQWKLMFQK